MTVLLETQVTSIGDSVEELLKEKTLILFDETIPEELRDISVLHSGKKLHGEIQPGDTLYIDDQEFEIYFVGDRVNQSIRELGHVTFKFNGSKKDMPGSICIEEKSIPPIEVGSVIKITR